MINNEQYVKIADLFTDEILTGLTTSVPASSLTGELIAGVAVVGNQRVNYPGGSYTVAASGTSYLDLDWYGNLHVSTSATVTPNSLRLWEVVSSTYITSVNLLASVNMMTISQMQVVHSVLLNPGTYFPLGQPPLASVASLTQTTPSGYINYEGFTYQVPTYTSTYAASSDTYEFLNMMGGIDTAVVSNGAKAPMTPMGDIPFQKVSTTFLDTPAAPAGTASTSSSSSMPSGTYDYQIVALNASGNSLPSATLSLSVATSGSVSLAWRLVPYQTSTQIYRNGALLTTVTGQTYTDTAASASGAAPPTTNTSNFVYRTTPLFNAVDTRTDKVVNLGIFGPSQGSDITALLLGCLDYGVSLYQGGSYNTEHGAQPAYLMNGVRVVIPDGQFVISQPITVPPGITLDFDGLLTNSLSDQFTPCITWGMGSFSNLIQVNANSNSGIQLGTATTQNNIRFGGVRVASVGQVYNPVLALNQVGLMMSGYNITADTLQIDTANLGLYLLNASDIRIGRCLVVGCTTGFTLSGCEQVGIDFIDVDSPQYLGATIDSSHDVVINGTAWLNDTGYGGSANTRNFIQIGAYSSASNSVAGLNLKLSLLNCGDIPLSVANIDQSHVEVIVGTGDLYTGSNYPPQSVVSYGANVGSGFLLTGTAVIPTASNWNNNSTPSGAVDLVVNGAKVYPGSGSLAGTTAGSVEYVMPAQAEYKKFAAYANGYENDTTTAQSITFFTPFVNTPAISTNTSGLTVTASTTALTISAPNATTTYTGYIILEGI